MPSAKAVLRAGRGDHLIRTLAFAAAALLAAPAAAHDFWLQPDRFHVAPGDEVAVALLIGEPGAVEPWALEWRKVASFQDFAPDHMFDLQASLDPLEGRAPAAGRVDARLTLSMPGTHMLAFASHHALSDLPADEFAAYLEHEGLAGVIAYRKRMGTEGQRGRELYSRRAKALVQVGPTPTDSVSRPIGQTLEIVPERNPLLLAPGDMLSVRVLFHGKPLAGVSVVLESLAADARHATPTRSDAQGRAAFPVPAWGAHKINVVWGHPIADPRADYETIFASLTFERTKPPR